MDLSEEKHPGNRPSGPDFITIHPTVVETFQSEPQCWTEQHFHVWSQAGSLSKPTQTTLTWCLHGKLRRVQGLVQQKLQPRCYDQIRLSRVGTRKPLKTKLQTERTVSHRGRGRSLSGDLLTRGSKSCCKTNTWKLPEASLFLSSVRKSLTQLFLPDRNKNNLITRSHSHEEFLNYYAHTFL